MANVLSKRLPSPGGARPAPKRQGIRGTCGTVPALRIAASRFQPYVALCAKDYVVILIVVTLLSTRGARRTFVRKSVDGDSIDRNRHLGLVEKDFVHMMGAAQLLQDLMVQLGSRACEAPLRTFLT